jgi:hypothetical protein
MVTGADATERVSVPVPDELRAMRRALGFDYGKFDFVVNEGKAVLLDANRTPTAGGPLSDSVRAHMSDLAEGVSALLA